MTYHLSIYLLTYLNSYLSFYLNSNLSIYLNSYLSKYTYISNYLSKYLSIHLNIYLSIYLYKFISSWKSYQPKLNFTQNSSTFFILLILSSTLHFLFSIIDILQSTSLLVTGTLTEFFGYTCVNQIMYLHICIVYQKPLLSIFRK